MEKTTSFFPGEQYVPSAFTRLLWWLSTAEAPILKDCVIDRNRYSIVGMSVLGTWLFATMAWSYFFYTVTTDYFMAIGLGIFMGLLVLSIDRALIKGINRRSNKKIGAWIFRLVLALSIGTFMAQPALLYLFKAEVQLQTSLDNEARRKAKQTEINHFYASSVAALENEQTLLQQQQNNRYQEVAKARENYLAEADGSGGTGKVGISTIALAKQKAYNQLNDAYQIYNDSTQREARQLQIQLDSIRLQKAAQQAAYERYFNNGFLTQIEALNHLIQANPALQFRYYLLVLILLLIELIPVIAKSMLPAGSYEERVQLKEELELDQARQQSNMEQQLRTVYNEQAQTQNQSTIVAFFESTKAERSQRMQQQAQQWKQSGSGSFSDLLDEWRNDHLARPQ